jgi:hypothetical protein
MIASLKPLQRQYQFSIRIVDVDSDAQLTQRFGEKVPVLMLNATELCHYVLDVPVVTAALAKIR